MDTFKLWSSIFTFLPLQNIISYATHTLSGRCGSNIGMVFLGLPKPDTINMVVYTWYPKDSWPISWLWNLSDNWQVHQFNDKFLTLHSGLMLCGMSCLKEICKNYLAHNNCICSDLRMYMIAKSILTCFGAGVCVCMSSFSASNAEI